MRNILSTHPLHLLIPITCNQTTISNRHILICIGNNLFLYYIINLTFYETIIIFYLFFLFSLFSARTHSLQQPINHQTFLLLLVHQGLRHQFTTQQGLLPTTLQDLLLQSTTPLVLLSHCTILLLLLPQCTTQWDLPHQCTTLQHLLLLCTIHRSLLPNNSPSIPIRINQLSLPGMTHPLFWIKNLVML